MYTTTLLQVHVLNRPTNRLRSHSPLCRSPTSIESHRCSKHVSFHFQFQFHPGSIKIITDLYLNSHAPPSILAHCTKTQAKAPQFHCALVPSPCRVGSTHCTLHQCQFLPVPTKHEQHPHAPCEREEKTKM